MLRETETKRSGLRIAVVVATLGRRQDCEGLLGDLRNQTRRPERIIFTVVNVADAPDVDFATNVQVVVSPRKGLCAQRNAALDALNGDFDAVLFLDDDFVPAPDYVEMLERAFIDTKDVGGITGVVIADGIGGPGLTRAQALSLIDAHPAPKASDPGRLSPRRGLYGCNMAIRTGVLGDLRFEEKLPLYGWLEDLDMSTRLSKRSRLAVYDRMIGVHLGVKRGRVSGVRLGYSQIANPVFLLVRGRGPIHFLLANITRNLIANAARALRPEPWIDRRGRLKGNLLGIADLFRGRLDPMRVVDLQ